MRQGQPTGKAAIRPFVLLRHELSPSASIPSHWDLMIESDGRLATWRLWKDWLDAPRQTVEQISDHRMAYLDYEGPLSQDRGTVHRVLRGDLHIVEWTNVTISGEAQYPGGTATLCLSRTDQRSHWILEWGRKSATSSR